MIPLNKDNTKGEQRVSSSKLRRKNPTEILKWLSRSQRREEFLLQLKQPMTLAQISKRMRLNIDAVCDIARHLVSYGIIKCLNPEARIGRVYWLTRTGNACQRLLRKRKGLPPLDHDFPIVDWDLYGSVCFEHRAAVIKALAEPLQPASIRRRAILRDEKLRMNSRNARDVIHVLMKKDIVKPVTLRKKHHPRYLLTEVGEKIQILLNRAEEFG